VHQAYRRLLILVGVHLSLSLCMVGSGQAARVQGGGARAWQLRTKTLDNDTSQRFVDTGERPQNFVQGTAYTEHYEG
jgi:hypothetical protein